MTVTDCNLDHTVSSSYLWVKGLSCYRLPYMLQKGRNEGIVPVLYPADSCAKKIWFRGKVRILRVLLSLLLSLLISKSRNCISIMRRVNDNVIAPIQ